VQATSLFVPGMCYFSFCSESHNCCHDWVSVWLHTGHLYIDGRKMSKSLKNFITIREFLASTDNPWSNKPATDFRIMCLQQKYYSSMYFSVERMKEASSVRASLCGFYDTFLLASLKHSKVERAVAANVGSSEVDISYRRLNSESSRLSNLVRKTRTGISSSLRDDFDTPTALRHLCQLADETRKYCLAYLNHPQAHGTNKNEQYLVFEPVLGAVRLLDYVLSVLGFHTSDFRPDTSASADSTKSSVELKAIIMLHEFRQQIRQRSLEGLKSLSKNSKCVGQVAAGDSKLDLLDSVKENESLAKAPLLDILKSCDHIRDEATKLLNIQIEDGSAVSTWKRIQ
jgi:cysteinyl-tRNA synthetase